MRLVGFVHFLQGQVNDFLSEVIPETGRSYDPEGKDKDLSDIANNFRHFWIMVDDEQKIIGTIAIADVIFDEKYAESLHRNSGELKCMYLDKNFRGLGYGEKMLSFAIDQARSFGYNWLYVDSDACPGHITNERYIEFGFETISRYNNNPDAELHYRLKL